jgi:hypothetical protein
VPSLSALLEDIQEPILVDPDRIAESIETQLGEQLDKMLSDNDFVRQRNREFVVEYFATEIPAVLFVEISGLYICDDQSDEARTDAHLQFTCDGSYSIEEKNFAGLSPTKIELNFVDSEGEAATKRIIIARVGGIVLGHRTINHQVRRRLISQP